MQKRSFRCHVVTSCGARRHHHFSPPVSKPDDSDKVNRWGLNWGRERRTEGELKVERMRRNKETGRRKNRRAGEKRSEQYRQKEYGKKNINSTQGVNECTWLFLAPPPPPPPFLHVFIFWDSIKRGISPEATACIWNSSRCLSGAHSHHLRGGLLLSRRHESPFGNIPINRPAPRIPRRAQLSVTTVRQVWVT